uniref:Major facilitator superfamily (MFS) profile domain-containing protein n=1 Tax=Aureoumbra lagunensis TaxID=44058 RepID=A0A7S3K5Q6_9STRA
MNKMNPAKEIWRMYGARQLLIEKATRKRYPKQWVQTGSWVKEKNGLKSSIHRKSTIVAKNGERGHFIYDSPILLALQSVPNQYRMGLAVISSAQGALNFGFGVIVPVLPTFAASTLGLGATGVGFVLAVPALMRVALNATAGRLSDRIGRIPMMTFGEFIAALGIIGTGISGGFLDMVCARSVLGVGGAAATAGSSAWTADLTSLRSVRPHRGVIMGTMGAITSASWVLGPAVGGLLCDLVGQTNLFAGVGFLATTCSIAYAFCVPEVEKSHLSTHLINKQQNTQSLFSYPLQRAAIIANAALAANYAVALSVLPLQYTIIANASTLEIGCLFSAMAGMGILGGPISGAVSDRYGRAFVVAPGLTICALGNLALAAAPDANTFIIAALILGAGEAVAAPAISAASADAAPSHRRSEALALSRTATDLVFVALPPIMGLAADGYGGYLPFTAVSAASALAAMHAAKCLR